MNSNLSIGAVSGIKVQFGSIVVFRSTPGIYVECGPQFGFLQPILVLIRQNKQPTTQNMARNFVGNILYTICCQHSVYSICRDQTWRRITLDLSFHLVQKKKPQLKLYEINCNVVFSEETGEAIFPSICCCLTVEGHKRSYSQSQLSKCCQFLTTLNTAYAETKTKSKSNQTSKTQQTHTLKSRSRAVFP